LEKNEERKLKEFGGENYGEASINMNNEKNLMTMIKKLFPTAQYIPTHFQMKKKILNLKKKVNIIF